MMKPEGEEEKECFPESRLPVQARFVVDNFSSFLRFFIFASRLSRFCVFASRLSCFCVFASQIGDFVASLSSSQLLLLLLVLVLSSELKKKIQLYQLKYVH
jgi:hypothetical protein